MSSESSSASEAEVESEDSENEEDSDDDFSPEKQPKKQSLKTTTEKPKQCWLSNAVEKGGAKKKTPAAGRVKPKSKPK